MNIRVAMIPMICPLYRVYVWQKMSELEGIDFEFLFEDENKLNNIKYIPKETLNKLFVWHKIKNRYFKGICFWQSGVLKFAFKNFDALIMSGNIRCFSTWITAFSAILMGKQVYFWSHGIYGKEGKITLFLKKLFFSLATDNFFYGNHSQKLLLSYGFDKNRNHVIYNSLDYDSHKSKRGKLTTTKIYQNHFDNENPVLIFIGRLTPQKKLNQFLEAAEQVENNYKKINIVFIGDGTQRTSLEKLAHSLNLSTWFYGESYNENELANLIYNADLCVSPGNVGLTVIHSLSYGTPVITHGDLAHQMPEAEAIKPKYNGDYFKRNSIEDLATSITNWLSHNQARREQVRKNCYEIIDEKYNPYFQSQLIKRILNKNAKSVKIS